MAATPAAAQSALADAPVTEAEAKPKDEANPEAAAEVTEVMAAPAAAADKAEAKA